MSKQKIEWATKVMVSRIVEQGITGPRAMRRRIIATINELNQIGGIHLKQIGDGMVKTIESLPRKRRRTVRRLILV